MFGSTDIKSYNQSTSFSKSTLNFNQLAEVIYNEVLTPAHKYIIDTHLTRIQPNISGYNIILMVPPILSAIKGKVWGGSMKREFSKFMTFAGVNFSVPVRQVEVNSTTSRGGSVPFASDVTKSQQCSVTFLDTSEIEIYTFHHIWINYIHELLDGTLCPDDEYFDPESPLYGALDYVCSFFVVKFDPAMRKILFVGKITGAFPLNNPSNELLGQRSQHDLVLLPYNYICADYTENVDKSEVVYKELMDLLQDYF